MHTKLIIQHFFFLKLVLHLPFLPLPFRPSCPQGASLALVWYPSVLVCVPHFLLTHFPHILLYFSVVPPNYNTCVLFPFMCEDSLWRFSSSALHFFFLGGGGSELRKELKLPLLESLPSCNSPTLLTDPSPFWG